MAAPQAAPRTMRVDQLLVERGLAENPGEARVLILAGRVLGRGIRFSKPGLRARSDAEISVMPAPRYVSRGGDKLEAALAAWPVDPSGRICLDVGASTGGFTDCLLQRGAAHVTAVDVGYGQLDQTLRRDPRVGAFERTHVREMPPLAPRPSLAVVDVSFIGLEQVLPHVRAAAAPGADVIALIKPQFEAPRDAVDADGVVRDRLAQAAAVSGVAAWAIAGGWRVGGVLRSPLAGPAGNREWFLWLRTPEGGEAA